MRVKFPKQVADIYRAVQELEANYPGRKFTPDGHLVGSIGEVIAAEALGLKLYPPSHPRHDARDANGCDVQIKLTGHRSVALYSTCDRLLVLKVVNSEEAEIVYDGPGEPAWAAAGKRQKNGQRSIRLSKLKQLSDGQVVITTHSAPPIRATPVMRQVLERGRSGRPNQTAPLPIAQNRLQK
jgi:uncharacterized protein DUF6998